MYAIVWIAESGWEACIAHAKQLPEDAELTLLHVSPADAEGVAVRGAGRLLGRRGPQLQLSEGYRDLAESEAQALLSEALGRLGRPARTDSRHGRVEREVVAAADGADLLIAARDGELKLGPKSLGRHTRFVVDHAPCPVLLVWQHTPPGAATIPAPPDHRPGPPPLNR